MTLSTTIARYQYVGNGVTTSFSFPAVFIAPADIVVSLRDAAGNVTSPTRGGLGTYDYAVTGALDATTGEYLTGGAILFNNAPPGGYRVTLYRDPPETQTVALQTGSSFNVNTANTEFDKLTMLVQAVRDQLSRGLVIPADDLLSLDMRLPNSALRGGRLLGFDGNGAPALFTPTSQNLAVLGPTFIVGDPFVATLSYTGSTTKTKVMANLGTAAAPDTTQDAVAIFEKWTNGGPGSLTSYIEASLYAGIFKGLGGTAAGSRATAGFFEAEDRVGGGFVEASRNSAILNTGAVGSPGSAYGGIFTAGETATSPHVYLTGAEAEVDVNSAAATYAFNPNGFAAAFVASSGGSKRPDSAFLINPYVGPGILGGTLSSYQSGFHVPQGNGTLRTVVTSGFRMDERDAIWGLDALLAFNLFGVIRGANNISMLRQRNAANSADRNLIQLDGSDNLLLGPDAGITQITLGSASATPILALGAGMTVANGSVATTMTSLGPVGSHTTIQEWVKYTNASGVVRYLPAY